MVNDKNGLPEHQPDWAPEQLDALNGEEAEQFFAQLDAIGNDLLGLNDKRPSGAGKAEPEASGSRDAEQPVDKENDRPDEPDLPPPLPMRGSRGLPAAAERPLGAAESQTSIWRNGTVNGNNGLPETQPYWAPEQLDSLNGEEAEQFFAELDAIGNDLLGLNDERPSGAGKAELEASGSRDAEQPDILKGDKAEQSVAEFVDAEGKRLAADNERTSDAKDYPRERVLVSRGSVDHRVYWDIPNSQTKYQDGLFDQESCIPFRQEGTGEASHSYFPEEERTSNAETRPDTKGKYRAGKCRKKQDRLEAQRGQKRGDGEELRKRLEAFKQGALARSADIQQKRIEREGNIEEPRRRLPKHHSSEGPNQADCPDGEASSSGARNHGAPERDAQGEGSGESSSNRPSQGPERGLDSRRRGRDHSL